MGSIVISLVKLVCDLGFFLVMFGVKLYDELESVKNLTEIFKELNKTSTMLKC